MQTRSGCRSAAQSTPRSTARAPRDGTPRWKSERCDDPQPVELRRQPRHLELELAQSHPPGLEPAPAETRRRGGPQEGSGAAPEGDRAGIRPSLT